MKESLIKLFGANYRTTLTGFGVAISGGLTFLAALPYEHSALLSMIVPPEWKEKVIIISGSAAIALKFLNSIFSKANNVSGNASAGFAVSTSQGEKITIVPTKAEGTAVTVQPPSLP